MTDTPKKQKVFLALPTYANAMRKDFVLSLLEILCFNPIPNVEWVIGTVGGDGVARARNNLAQSFLLTTDCDLFFNIDVDIVFAREQVVRLLSHVSAKRPIIGGQYAAKQVNHRWIYTALPNEVADADGLVKVQECGTGFKVIHRRYFEEVMAAFPEIQYFCDGSKDKLVKWDFFSMGVVNGRYLSEDYYADYRARKIGMDIYVDTKCEVQHEGFMRYPFKDNIAVFEKMPIATLFDLAQNLGKTQPKDFDSVVKSLAA